jgi:hypothetical protein
MVVPPHGVVMGGGGADGMVIVTAPTTTTTIATIGNGNNNNNNNNSTFVTNRKFTMPTQVVATMVTRIMDTLDYHKNDTVGAGQEQSSNRDNLNSQGIMWKKEEET